MEHVYVWMNFVQDLPEVFFAVFCLGGIFGGAVVAQFKARSKP